MSSFDWGGGGSASVPDANSTTKGSIKLTNNLAGTADLPEVVDLTISGEQLGSILYHNGTDWVQLSPGDAGKFLSTNGIGAAPTWETSPSAVDATTLAKGIVQLTNDLAGTASSPQVVDLTISGQAQGSILYFNGTNWVQLSPGTSGYVLSTNGAGQNPSWIEKAIPGDATTLAKGIVQLTNDLAGTATSPEVVDLTISGQVQGSILYFNGTNWVQLSPGSIGDILYTNGSGQNPSWGGIQSSINSGTAALNFGASPGGNYAEVNVAGQTGISSTSSIKVWIQASTTADHNEFEHLMLNMNSGLSFGNIINNVGFTIYLLTELRVSGSFLINWEWI